VLHIGTVQIQDKDLVLDQEQIAQIQIAMKTACAVKGSHRVRRKPEDPASLGAFGEARLDPSTKVSPTRKIPSENPPPVNSSPGAPKMKGEHLRRWNASLSNCLRNPKFHKESMHSQKSVAEKFRHQPTVAKASQDHPSDSFGLDQEDWGAPPRMVQHLSAISPNPPIPKLLVRGR
jgi:hypothetical protein